VSAGRFGEQIEFDKVFSPLDGDSLQVLCFKSASSDGRTLSTFRASKNCLVLGHGPFGDVCKIYRLQEPRGLRRAWVER